MTLGFLKDQIFSRNLNNDRDMVEKNRYMSKAYDKWSEIRRTERWRMTEFACLGLAYMK